MCGWGRGLTDVWPHAWCLCLSDARPVHARRPAVHGQASAVPRAAQRSTAQHSTAQRSAAQHSTAHRSTAQRSAAQHSTAQHSTAQHSTAQHSTAQHQLRGLRNWQTRRRAAVALRAQRATPSTPSTAAHVYVGMQPMRLCSGAWRQQRRQGGGAAGGTQSGAVSWGVQRAAAAARAVERCDAMLPGGAAAAPSPSS
jgi:hypothetical protein